MLEYYNQSTCKVEVLLEILLKLPPWILYIFQNDSRSTIHRQETNTFFLSSLGSAFIDGSPPVLEEQLQNTAEDNKTTGAVHNGFKKDNQLQ